MFVSCIKTFFFTLLCLLSFASYGQAHFKLDNAETELMVVGKSSTHNWQMTAVEASGELSAKIIAGELNSITNLKVQVPATSIKSGKDIMEGKAHEAIKASTHPIVSFVIKKAEKTQGKQWLLTGDFSLAGVTKTWAITAELAPTASGV